ncbi:MAG: UDP-2,4-diacetamido-2,4,6-trideoxy-beta-L-altropyranose hydrolase [Methanobrevibacter sp.]|uniref:cytidylyltransferase domain-containing protein n=1 Tax=uncultured Methanobrevibacter sp. TaxID=253161 RepID=UPI0025F35A3A|nr:UDP-2,4-diacetamido-2,4,6-trideoxy-beta-L-altropyranose hydrolase [uncultured Methanobrevibacter sp.]MEE1129105.1 UDP-2,4-diacetamido-2,4,6-trideoxy-beta-L-altropyranose hydrolase [Methanobrevibacter sp.]
MFNNNKILVVIPARSSSGKIPRKNLRLLGNKPLISYSIRTARNSQYVDDIVVATDDSEVALLSEKFGASVFRYSNDSEEPISIDALIYNAMIQKEKLALDEYDIVITLEPSAPLLETQTLDNAIEKFEDFAIDSVVTVVDDRHLNWGYDEENQRYFPLYIKRVERDLLPKSFKETGSLLATRRSFVYENSRLGTNIDLIELSKKESINIVDNEDLLVAENYLQKKRIAIVVDANDEMGTRNLDRCLSIASKLFFHDILFLIEESRQLGINILNKYKYPFHVYDGEDELFEKLKQFSPHIVVNDILDTSSDYILKLKNEGYFVVNFEDLGVGSEFADVVFDSLYEQDSSQKNIFTGYKYYILKEEFYFQPQKIITNEVNNVLIYFDRADSDNLTEKVLNSILATNFNGRINIILGLNYPDKEGFISKIEINPAIQVYTDTSNISEFMFKADIIFTSAGKPTYDVCSLGVPTICLSQDERELTHVFCGDVTGFINLGLGSNISQNEIMEQFVALVNNFEKRLEMNEKMLAVDLKNGFDNVYSVIKEEYRKFILNR